MKGGELDMKRISAMRDDLQLPAESNRRAQLPQQYEPERHALNVAALDYSIEHAKRIKDWPALEDAVDQKIAEQKMFLAWWQGNVARAGQPKKNSPRTRLILCDEAEKLTGLKHQRVSDLGKKLKKEDKYRIKLLGAGYKAALLDAAENHRAEGTGENEWFTPEKYIEAARKVMGGIDLDPASNPIAQDWIRATKFFTRADNGLAQQWHGRIWLNPPYAQPLIWQFCEKLVEELSSGRVDQAILLTHNYTDTAWFHHAEQCASLICFTRGRIPFVDDDGEDCAPTQGQAFFYYGDKGDEFRTVFTEFGFIR